MVEDEEIVASPSRQDVEDLARDLAAMVAAGLVGDAATLLVSRAVGALFAAARTARPDECRLAVPYSGMYRVREADGKVYLTCDHPTPHKTLVHE